VMDYQNFNISVWANLASHRVWVSGILSSNLSTLTNRSSMVLCPIGASHKVVNNSVMAEERSLTYHTNETKHV